MSTLEDVKTADWSPGTVIEETYVIAETIEEDGTTAVYRAETVEGRHPRVIRALCADLADDSVASREFKEICQLIRKASHANLPRVEATGESSGRPFIATAAADGQPLDELLRNHGHLEPARACAIARQVASALEAAHRFGLLHLDLDPRQITISGKPGEEHVTLRGLGAAQMRISRVRRLMSGASATAGALTIRDLMPAVPAYCAPETTLARSAESLDGRADLYALGVLTYQLLTGRLPISAATPEDDVLGMLAAQVDMGPSALEPDASIPAPLMTLIRQLLETRRELRPSTARVAADWLARVTTAASSRRGARAAALKEERPPAVARPMPAPVLARERKSPVIEPVASGGSVAPPEPPAPAPPIPAAPRQVVSQPLDVTPPAKPAFEPGLEPAFDAVFEPAPEPILASEAEPVLNTAKEPLPDPQAAAESAAEAARVFDELLLDAPPPNASASPIVLRPGGRVVSQNAPPAEALTIAGEAEISSAGPAAAGTLPPAPSMDLGSSTSVLFKTKPAPQPPAGWGRRALAALVVVLIGALALFFIGKSKQLQWNSPTPTTVDQEHSLSRPDANAEVTPSTSPPGTKPGASRAAPASSAPAQNQPQSSSGSSQKPGPAQNPTAGVRTAPPTGLVPGATARAAGQRAPATRPAAKSGEVQRAVAAGDVFYETGQYDLAIQTYGDSLKNHPQNQLLLGRIARAKKAKAAEQEYLGQ